MLNYVLIFGYTYGLFSLFSDIVPSKFPKITRLCSVIGQGKNRKLQVFKPENYEKPQIFFVKFKNVFLENRVDLKIGSFSCNRDMVMEKSWTL